MKLRLRSLPGTDLQLSTFSCGLGDLFTMPQNQWEKVLETYVEAGGNFFDTAHAYCHWVPGGNGLSEITIGEYIRKHGLKNAVVATKGGHPSAWRYRTIPEERYLAPGRLAADIDDSLARLECDTIAIYYLHRDDPRVPVGEIMDYLNTEIHRGRLRYIGVSNWTVRRIEEANEYAGAKKLHPFIISEPLWSLAQRKPKPTTNLPCVDNGSLNAESVAWYRKNNFPASPYTPVAHGFFAGPSESAEKEYGTPENHQRRERVLELAEKQNATPTQIALAWLVNHPFPVFPILGTKNPARLKEALGADTLQLTDKELAWLDRGDV